MACSSKDAVQSAAPSKEAVAATVDGIPISESLVSLMLKQRSDLGRDAGADVRKAYIDRLAMQLIISQAAIKEGLDKAPEVADQIELIKQSVLVDAFVKNYFKNNPVSDDAVNAAYAKIRPRRPATSTRRGTFWSTMKQRPKTSSPS